MGAWGVVVVWYAPPRGRWGVLMLKDELWECFEVPVSIISHSWSNIKQTMRNSCALSDLTKRHLKRGKKWHKSDFFQSLKVYQYICMLISCLFVLLSVCVCLTFCRSTDLHKHRFDCKQHLRHCPLERYAWPRSEWVFDSLDPSLVLEGERIYEITTSRKRICFSTFHLNGCFIFQIWHVAPATSQRDSRFLFQYYPIWFIFSRQIDRQTDG